MVYQWKPILIVPRQQLNKTCGGSSTDSRYNFVQKIETNEHISSTVSPISHTPQTHGFPAQLVQHNTFCANVWGSSTVSQTVSLNILSYSFFHFFWMAMLFFVNKEMVMTFQKNKHLYIYIRVYIYIYICLVSRELTCLSHKSISVCLLLGFFTNYIA